MQDHNYGQISQQGTEKSGKGLASSGRQRYSVKSFYGVQSTPAKKCGRIRSFSDENETS